jgi:hypothetical protein
MSERHPAAVAASPPRPHAPPHKPPAAAALPPWVHLFPALPPDAQAALLRTAAATGHVPAHALPALPPTAGSHDRADRFLARLFADGPPLPAFDPAPLSNPDRPPAEFHAISAAVGCPDLFLIDAPAGPGRVNLVADLAAEVARSSGRVLVLTANAGSADAVLARLAEHHPADPCAIAGRAVAPAESAAHLPPVSAARTARAHGDGAVAAARQRAEADAATADGKLAALQAVTATLDAIRTARRERERIAAEEAAASEIPAEPEAVRAANEKHAAELAGLDESARKAAAEIAAGRAEVAALRDELARLADAKKGSGVVGLFKGWFAKDDTPAKCADLQPKLTAAEGALADREAAAAKLSEARTAAAATHAAEVAAMLGEEAARRDARAAQLAADRGRLEATIAEGFAELSAAGFAGTDPDRIAGEVAESRAKLTAEAAVARGWAADLAAHPADFAARFVSQVRVVVGPAPAAGVDPLVAPRPGDPAPPFDRLILADADHLGEPEFCAAARHAARWILVGDSASLPPPGRGEGWGGGRLGGEPTPHPNPPPQGGRGPERLGEGFSAAGRKNGRGPAPPRPSLFGKLWHRLHKRPWVAEGDALVARFLDAPRAALRPEPLADRPDIEVRFVEVAGEASLAEVRFPPDLGPADAKAFLACELGEVRLAPCGPVRWAEDADRVTAGWPAAEAAARSPVWVDLEPGVREKVVGSGPDALTAAVVFDKSAGWSRESAAGWVSRQSAGVLGSRTAACRTPAPVPQPAFQTSGPR